jgi:cellulose synthase (UDP-forming)
LVDTLRDTTEAPNIQGDFALFAGRHITSYRVGSLYTVGSLPLWLWPEYLLRDRPLAMAGLLVGACFLLSLAAYWWLRRRAASRLAAIRGRP